jgi:hypothetical protein
MAGQVANIALGIDKARLLSASLSKTDEFHEGVSCGVLPVEPFKERAPARLMTV